MMNCDEIRDLLSPWVDDELDAERRREVSAHLEGCVRCSAELEAINRLGTWLQADVDPVDLRGRVLAGLGDRRTSTVSWLRTAAAVAASIILGFAAGGALQQDDDRSLQTAVPPVLAELDGSFGSASLAGFDDLADDLQRAGRR